MKAFITRLASFPALAAAVAGQAAGAGQADLRPRLIPITAPIRHAGVFHVATGTWTKSSNLASLIGPDTIYDNTCHPRYLAAQTPYEKWQHRAVLPSPSRPYGPCSPLFQSAPGCHTSYTINGFRFGYCSSASASIDWSIEFADLYGDCAGSDMVPARSFALTGLPGGTPTGAQQCWTVDLDLSAVNPPFVLQADGDGSYDGIAAQDQFGVSIGPTSLLIGLATGPILAGNFTRLSGTFAPCSGTDGTIWDTPVDPTEEGTGMGSNDFFRATGSTAAPGCYSFGGPTRGIFLELYSNAGCPAPPPPPEFCFPGQGGVIGCPCVNPPADAQRGCNNSSNTGGATLFSFGSSSLSGDTLFLVAKKERPSATSVFLQGTTQIATGVAFGQGVRCAGGILKRLYTKAASGGTAGAGGTCGDATVSSTSAALGNPILAGQNRYYQVYYRDPIVLGGCPAASTFNVTQGLAIAWSL